MVLSTFQDEYLAEIRAYVCARCVERPPGGPPCEPLGKICGVEAHLPELIALVHTTTNKAMDPYFEHFQGDICRICGARTTSQCPCAVSYLLPLVVEAVENVDERIRAQDETRKALLGMAH